MELKKMNEEQEEMDKKGLDRIMMKLRLNPTMAKPNQQFEFINAKEDQPTGTRFAFIRVTPEGFVSAVNLLTGMTHYWSDFLMVSNTRVVAARKIGRSE
jgi:Na+-translocating ferredoxin:NAD+ oxidoreductase RnfG subunit